MAVDLRGVTVVILPGTGSDDDFVRRAFSVAVHRAGAILQAPAPEPAHLIRGYLDALDAAARIGPIAVGGVSIGAAVAAAWALSHPDHTRAVLAGMPAWSGDPGTATAAAAAQATAHTLRNHGLADTVAQMQGSSPTWLGDELARSWAAQWPDLPTAMEDAARYRAPTLNALAGLAAPLGVAGASDDAVHPLLVAEDWAQAAPRAGLRRFTLADFGRDPGLLGRCCLAALAEA